MKTWSALKNLQSATLTPLVSNKGYVLSLDSFFLSYLHLGRKGIAAFWWVDHNILKNALLRSKMTIGMSMSVKQNLHAFSNLDAYLVKKRTIWVILRNQFHITVYLLELDIRARCFHFLDLHQFCKLGVAQ